MNFIQSFLADYSKCGLSKSSDRAVAISGLAARVARTLACEERYGIFGSFLHRNLLWERSPSQRMKRIEYGDNKVPSWSWMAYEGGIQFTEFSFGNLELFDDLKFAQDKRALVTKVWEFQGCQLEQEAVSGTTRHRILDSCGTERGWIMYDVEDGGDLHKERGVVVARPLDKSEIWEYYMLVVKQRAEGGYERVGIGRVECGYISRQEPDVLVL